MNYISRIGVAVVVLSLFGCGASNIRSGSSLDLDDNSAFLLLGMTPEYRIHLLHGSIEGSVWVRPKLDVPEVNTFPENGYILVKVKPTTPTDRMSVSIVFPEKRGQGHGPCMNSIAPTFELEPGAITYVGHLEYLFDGQQLRYTSKIDEDAAKAFLKANYPGYAGAFHSRPMTQMKVNSHFCDPRTITIPIYIPRR
jgi:hypothetical protein